MIKQMKAFWLFFTKKPKQRVGVNCNKNCGANGAESDGKKLYSIKRGKNIYIQTDAILDWIPLGVKKGTDSNDGK